MMFFWLRLDWSRLRAWKPTRLTLPKAAKDAIEFYVTMPFDQGPATPGNGTMIALAAPTMQALEQFHRLGLQNGGSDEGAPGPREEGSRHLLCLYSRS